MNSENCRKKLSTDSSAVLFQHRWYLSFFGIPTSTIYFRFGEDQGNDLSYWLLIPILVGFLWLIRDISINSSLMTLTVYVFFFHGNFQRSNINNEEIQFGRKFQTDWLRTSRYKPSFSFPFKRLSAQSISKWKNWIGSHSPNLNAILPVSQKSFRKIKKITLPRIELHFRLSIQLFVH